MPTVAGNAYEEHQVPAPPLRAHDPLPRDRAPRERLARLPHPSRRPRPGALPPLVSHPAARAPLLGQAWLKGLQAMHAAHMAKTVAGAAQRSPLPQAPLLWGRPEEANEPGGFGSSFDQHFAGIGLADDDFDAPVYRSLGGLVGADATGGLDLAEEEESPRYRSFGLAPAELPPCEVTAELADEAWLETMPPLIRRQPAHGPSIIAIP